MMREPVLASRSFAAGRFDGERVPMVLRVYGGLHYIRGNSAPYFSLTYWAHRKGFQHQCGSGGAGHETIAQYWGDKFADLAALHMSNHDGVPTSAVANGWYWFVPSIPGYPERYHGSNSKANVGGEYRERTPAESLAVFAKHVRVPIAEAEALVAKARNNGNPRGIMAAALETMRPRWKAEAYACVAAHGLQIYGDPWPVPVAEAS
jgi:hypothetical protein